MNSSKAKVFFDFGILIRFWCLFFWLNLCFLFSFHEVCYNVVFMHHFCIMNIDKLLIFSVKCSASGGNGSASKKTTLHDLYEKEGQSPWYDNLCRPVTDLLHLIASGVRGVTSNPAVITSFYVFVFFSLFQFF